MKRNRTAAAALGAVIALTAAGCGNDMSMAGGADRTSITRIPMEETVTLTVDGKAVPVQAAEDYSCKEHDGGRRVQLYNWSGGTPTPGPTAEVAIGPAIADASVSFGADGVRYSVAENRPGTSARGSKNGDEYVVEGTARSWDVTPELLKPFRITFTCNTKAN